VTASTNLTAIPLLTSHCNTNSFEMATWEMMGILFCPIAILAL
jgi:hypothetical protein